MKIHQSILIVPLVCLVTFAFWGCQPRTIAPSTAFDGSPLNETARQGRLIYLQKCSTCHTALPIHDYTAEEWRKSLPDMNSRTKLTAADSDAVGKYVSAVLGQKVYP